MYRVEDKFACSKRELWLLQARIGSVLKADRNQEKPSGYTISSVYFDDLNDTCYFDTVEGYAIREKYRIRIYNNSLKTIKLEVKYKQNNRVLKKAQSISEEQMRTLLKGECLADPHPSSDSPVTLFNLAIKEKGLRPKVIVDYERKAYVFEPGNIRITFDRNIRGSRQVEKFGQADLTFESPEEMDCVLEVKYDEFLPGFIAQLLETGNMIQTTCSKYKLCRERIGRKCQ